MLRILHYCFRKLSILCHTNSLSCIMQRIIVHHGIIYLTVRPFSYFQVVGKKYIRLYSSSLSEELSPHSGTMLHNSSQVISFLYCLMEELVLSTCVFAWKHNADTASHLSGQ